MARNENRPVYLLADGVRPGCSNIRDAEGLKSRAGASDVPRPVQRARAPCE